VVGGGLVPIGQRPDALVDPVLVRHRCGLFVPGLEVVAAVELHVARFGSEVAADDHDAARRKHAGEVAHGPVPPIVVDDVEHDADRRNEIEALAGEIEATV
jgi:hypothetical protein